MSAAVLRVLVLVAAAAVASACTSAPPRRSMLLITVDTLRPDHVTAEHAPALSALGAEGVVFDTAISVGPLTLPAHASLLTGRIPPAHGVRDNHIDALAAATPTFTARLQSLGYDTAAFVSAVVLDRRYGLDAGFDVYDDEMPGQQPERRAEETLARASEWLGARPDPAAPFFLWVHLFEPHAPYLSGSYAGDVGAADRAIGAFVASLRTRGTWDDLVVSVTSDHGESLGEHGEDTHGFFVYDSTIRIPWVLKAPGLAKGRFQPQVRVLDVLPTMMALAGASDDRAAPPGAALDGVDLTPYLAGNRDPGLDAYSETFLPRHQFDWAELKSIRTSSAKYVDAPRPELYRWREDPGEATNLAASDPAAVARLRSVVARVSANALTAPRRDGLDAVEAEKFLALGYIGQGRPASGGVDSDGARPDPKSKIEIYRLVMSALTLADAGRPDEALEALRRADAMEPDLTQVHYLRGVILGAEGRYREAAAALERTVQLNPRHVLARFKLALAFLRTGQTDRAESVLRAVVADEPRNMRAYQNLAALAYTRGDLEGAEALARQALAIEPEYFDAWNTLGAVYVLQERPADAVQALTTAIGLNPASGQALHNLSLAHRLGGDAASAAAALDKACALDRRYCP